MRATAVPAQVTTVEDRIMGNLGFSQIVLFILPIFISAGLFVILPPITHGSLYKYIVMVIITIISGILAIRIRGKIVLFWLITIARYNLRPSYYVFQKSVIHREEYKFKNIKQPKKNNNSKKDITTIAPKLTFGDAVYVMETINNSSSNIRFEITNKGGLNVRLTEVED